jgi:hypothetical protein
VQNKNMNIYFIMIQGSYLTAVFFPNLPKLRYSDVASAYALALETHDNLNDLLKLYPDSSHLNLIGNDTRKFNLKLQVSDAIVNLIERMQNIGCLR